MAARFLTSSFVFDFDAIDQNFSSPPVAVLFARSKLVAFSH